MLTNWGGAGWGEILYSIWLEMIAIPTIPIFHTSADSNDDWLEFLALDDLNLNPNFPLLEQ